MPDVLNISSNERIDLSDLTYATSTSQLAFQRILGANFITNASNTQAMWIVNGFAVTNPTGNQIQVTLGSAMLAYRTGASVNYGVVAAEGNPINSLDVTAYSAGAYGIYIRFNYLPGSTASRIFWNPTNQGSEFAQSVATRQQANWELKIEIANPGSEWLQIATVVVPSSGSLTLTDQRPFYFEGRVDQSYSNVWGTGSLDRNPDRADNGVHDLQTFTSAMRTCLEDIKGQGLRRWYAADIGGMCLGYVGTPTEDRLSVGDPNFYAQGNTNTPSLVFNAGLQDGSGNPDATWLYNRANKTWQWEVYYSGTSTVGNIMQLSAQGLVIGRTAPSINGLDVQNSVAVGSYAGTVTLPANCLAVSGQIMAGVSSVLTGDTMTVGGSAVSGFVSASVYNSSVGGATVRLVNPNHEFRVSINNSSTFEIYDKTNSLQRLGIDQSGHVTMPINLNIGAAAYTTTPLLTLTSANMGTTAASSIEHMRASFPESTDTDNLRLFSYRQSAGTLSPQVDWYMQRLINSTNEGFLFFGGPSGYLGAAGIGLGYGTAGSTAPGLFVSSTNIVTAGGYATPFANSQVPMQLSAGASTEAYFGVNKANAYGILFGYTNNSFTPAGGSSPISGSILRCVSTDPFYFITNSTTLSAQINSSGSWLFSTDPTATPLANVHIRASSPSANTSYGQLFIDGNVSSGAVARIRLWAGSGSSSNTVDFTHNGANTPANTPLPVFSLGSTATAGSASNNTFQLTDWINGGGAAAFAYNTSTRIFDFSGSTSVKAAGPTAYTIATTSVPIYVNLLQGNSFPGYGTVATSIGGTIAITPASTANGAGVSFPVHLPRGCTITGISMNGARSNAGATSTLFGTLVLVNTNGTNTNLLSASASTGINTTFTVTNTGSVSVPESTAGYVFFFFQDSNSGCVTTLYNITITVSLSTMPAALRG